MKNKQNNTLIKHNNQIIKTSPINIIYHDENIKFEGKGIVDDCYKIQNELKCTLILCNDLNNLNLLIKYIFKTNSKCKFFLIVNGSSAENVINYINKNKYKPLFITSCIYTKNKDKYVNIKRKFPDFVGDICVKKKEIINFINDYASKMKEYNEFFHLNTLINFYNYKDNYLYLHKQISVLYGEDSEKYYTHYFSKIKELTQKEKFSDEIKNEIIKCFEEFSFKNKDNYEKKIITFLKYDSFSNYLNKLLMTKDFLIYNDIGYFASNLINSIVEYGKKERKGIDEGKIFYSGMQLDVVDVLEFLKNRNYAITFPYFLRMATNKKSEELMYIKNSDKKEKEKYSVIMQIDYLYDDGFEPCAFDLRELAQYPDEEEYILLPFTFLHLKKITIDSIKLIADIHLQIIGKEEILEYQIKQGKSIEFDKDKNILFAK